jgi:acetyltransferase-like isoleucine patch superfamily enzyme
MNGDDKKNSSIAAKSTLTKIAPEFRKQRFRAPRPMKVSSSSVEINKSALVGDNPSVCEKCRVGCRSFIGGHVARSHACIVGSWAKIVDHTTMGGNTTLSDNVFIANDVQTADDKRRGRADYQDKLSGATIEDGAMIDVGALLLPGIVVRKKAIVGASSVVNVSAERDSRMFVMPARAVPVCARTASVLSHKYVE